MKIKLNEDFKSGSNFLILGINNKEIVKNLLKAEGINAIDFDYFNGQMISFYGNENKEPNYAGVKVDDLIEKMTLPQMKKFFKRLVKDKYNVDIKTTEMKLMYGEVKKGE